MCRKLNLTSKMRLNARKIKTRRKLNPSLWKPEVSSADWADTWAIGRRTGNAGVWMEVAAIPVLAASRCSKILPSQAPARWDAQYYATQSVRQLTVGPGSPIHRE